MQNKIKNRHYLSDGFYIFKTYKKGNIDIKNINKYNKKEQKRKENAEKCKRIKHKKEDEELLY